MDGVNTYNCQCPPEWTGKGFVCEVLCSCVTTIRLFVHSGLLQCHVQYALQCLKPMKDIRGFPHVAEDNLEHVETRHHKKQYCFRHVYLLGIQLWLKTTPGAVLMVMWCLRYLCYMK